MLRAANNLSNEIDMTEVENQSYEYYKRALTDGYHTAYLVFEKEFSYNGLSIEESVRHIAKFTSGIWQIHPFGACRL